MRTLRVATEALLWTAVGLGAVWFFLLVDLRTRGEEPGSIVDVTSATVISVAVVALLSTGLPTLVAWLRGFVSARLGAGATAIAVLGTSAAWSRIAEAGFLTTPTLVAGAALGVLALLPAPWEPAPPVLLRSGVRAGLAVAAVVLLVYPGLLGVAAAWQLGLVAPTEGRREGWATLLPSVAVVLACVAVLVHVARPGDPRRPLVLVVEHEEACPPAHLGRWLTEAGCDLEVCRPWSGDALPELAAYDALLVLGGSMGANDDAEVPWLGPLKGAIREAAHTGLPTLGVCLGHQLVAVALGGTVEPNQRGQQVGLLRVGWRPEADRDPLFGGLTGARRGIQWNTDVVTALPDDAALLAATPEGDAQVVRYRDRAWGVQLHPEADLDVVRSWAAGDRDDHLERGIDQDAVLHRIGGAADELADAWRPLALGFARIAGARR